MEYNLLNMNQIKTAMQEYFQRLLKNLKTRIDEDSPFICIPEGADNVLIISKRDDSGWVNWLPVEKNSITDFSALEKKYQNVFHKDIKSYYNQYWFYEIIGYMDVDQWGSLAFELERVVPSQEINDLESHIDRYYTGGDISNFRMIPIGFVYNLFVVVDNVTGEVFIDDRINSGTFKKIANNLAELINNLEP